MERPSEAAFKWRLFLRLLRVRIVAQSLELRAWLAVKFSRTTWILFALSGAAYVYPKYRADHGDPPHVGVYIAIVGLVVAGMSVREKPRPWEKAAWLVLIFMLTGAEIRDIYRAENEQAQDFRQISTDLQATKIGLEKANQDLTKTGQDIAQIATDEKSHFDSTMAKVDQTLLNTQPYADLEVTDLLPSSRSPVLNIGPESILSFNVLYANPVLSKLGFERRG